MHQSIFRAEKRIGLVLFGKGNIGSRWLELFRCDRHAFGAYRIDRIRAGQALVDTVVSLLNYEGLDASRALAFFDDEAVEQDESCFYSCGCAPTRMMI